MCIAFPGRVVAIDPGGALVETEGRLRRASTLLVDDLAIGGPNLTVDVGGDERID